MLGRGGMGTVYSARHVELGRQVALKVLSDELSSDHEFVARFRREGRLQASLEHPHVVTVYEAGESDHGLYLAMQLVPGPTLATLMSERALDSELSLALLHQVGTALDAAHEAGLVHRDVKPQNVLVGDSDDAYLGDFGLTRLGGDEAVTATGKLVGTLAYLAPEVIRGEEAGPASDRYAFAATVFACLTGTVVYPRRTEAALLFAHTSEPPPRISGRRPELPPALDDQFADALSKDPSDRPRSAAAFVDSVARAMAGTKLGPPPPAGAAALEAATAEPTPRPEVQPRRPPRRLVLWLAGAALAGAAVAAAVVLALGDGDEGEASSALPPLPGTKVLGSDLSEPGRTVDCRGRTPSATSSSCTIAQSRLPASTVVVPRDGVIRRWAVRSARGELSLAVVRPRSGGAFQVARSRNEFVEDDQVHAFSTDVAVEQGDIAGLVVLPGSAVGAGGGADGASTNRWIPLLTGTGRPPELGAGTGFDDELLFRVEYVPGGSRRRPAQVADARAAKLDPGRVRARRSTRYKDRTFEHALVAVEDRMVLDEFVEGRRTARVDVPGFRKGGRVITFEVDEGEPNQPDFGIYVEYANAESARILSHYYVVARGGFELVT